MDSILGASTDDSGVVEHMSEAAVRWLASRELHGTDGNYSPKSLLKMFLSFCHQISNPSSRKVLFPGEDGFE